MSLKGEQILLRAYVQNADRPPHMPTHERIVQAARKAELAGVTVLRGILGAGYHGILKNSTWSMVDHVPLVVEIVDGAAKISQFISEQLNEIMIGGMLTLERAAVIIHRQQSEAQEPIDSLPSALIPLSTVPRIEPGSHMSVKENCVLLRVFIGESDKFEDLPLYEAIVKKVRELGLSGATVLKGTEGFGAHSVVHTSHLLEMSTDLPIVVEVVDTEEKVKQLLPYLEKMVTEGMITMEYVAVLLYRHGEGEAPSQPSGGLDSIV